MAEIKANGSEIVACGENIIALCDEYLKQVNTLFDNLEKINKTAWSGNSADLYSLKVKRDKDIYVNFGDYLKMYGQVIRNTGTNINTIIQKWEDK